MSIRVSQTQHTSFTNGILNPIFKEILREIDELATLEEDWNCEGASSIDRASLFRAQKFVNYLSNMSTHGESIGDQAPAVFPTIEGGVQLYWNVNRHQVAITFDPSQKLIKLMEKMPEAKATFNFITETEACSIAFEAMNMIK